MTETVKIMVNGAVREVPARTSLQTLIEQLGMGKAACAAEVNRELVRRGEREERILRDGDSVELVTLVGGG
jgi:sulfur carrier protein